VVIDYKFNIRASTSQLQKKGSDLGGGADQAVFAGLMNQCMSKGINQSQVLIPRTLSDHGTYNNSKKKQLDSLSPPTYSIPSVIFCPCRQLYK